jgi:hypothetical protein
MLDLFAHQSVATTQRRTEITTGYATEHESGDSDSIEF